MSLSLKGWCLVEHRGSHLACSVPQQQQPPQSAIARDKQMGKHERDGASKQLQVLPSAFARGPMIRSAMQGKAVCWHRKQGSTRVSGTLAWASLVLWLFKKGHRVIVSTGCSPSRACLALTWTCQHACHSSQSCRKPGARTAAGGAVNVATSSGWLFGKRAEVPGALLIQISGNFCMY